jgi:hypothetical protein
VIKAWGNGPAISTQVGDAGVPSLNSVLNLTVTGNTASNPGVNTQHGFVANIGAAGIGSGDSSIACVDLHTNTLDGNAANSGVGIRLRQRESSTIKLPGYGGTQYNTSAVAALETAQNPGSTNAIATSNAGPGYVNTPGGAQCAQPTVPT